MDASKINVTSVASRLKERASQLASENASLQLHEFQLLETETKLLNIQRRSKELRKCFLSVELAHHEIEMSTMLTEEEKQIKSEEARQIILEVEQRNKETMEQKKRWDEKARSVYVSHVVELDVRLRLLESTAKYHECEKNQRIFYLQNICQMTDQTKLSLEKINEQEMALCEELLVSENKEQGDDEDASAMATQIKSTLSKRKELRLTLREVQNKLHSLKELALEKENECLQHSNLI